MMMNASVSLSMKAGDLLYDYISTDLFISW